MNMKTLGLSIIVGKETKILERLLINVSTYFDLIVVVMTKDNHETEEILKRFNCKIIKLENSWDDTYSNWDFAQARQLSYDNNSCDYIMYLDTDDTLDHPDNLKVLLADQTADAICLPYDYEQNQDGTTRNWYVKERIIKKGSYRWVGLVHECLIPNKEVNAITSDTVVVKHHLEYSKSRFIRNYTLIQKDYKQTGNPRSLFYCGIDALNVGETEDAEQYLKLFMKTDSPNEFKYTALMRLCLINQVAKEYEKVIEYASKATQLIPEWGEAYFKRAWAYYYSDQNNKALTDLNKGFFEAFEPITFVPHDSIEYSYIPATVLDLALTKERQYVEALRVVNHSLTKFPNDSYFSHRKVELSKLIAGILTKSDNAQLIKFMGAKT